MRWSAGRMVVVVVVASAGVVSSPAPRQSLPIPYARCYIWRFPFDVCSLQWPCDAAVTLMLAQVMPRSCPGQARRGAGWRGIVTRGEGHGGKPAKARVLQACRVFAVNIRDSYALQNLF